MMSTLPMGEEPPMQRRKTCDLEFIKSRKGQFILFQMVAALLAFVFAIAANERNSRSGGLELLIVASILAFTIFALEFVTRAFNLIEVVEVAKSNERRIDIYSERYLPISIAICTFYALLLSRRPFWSAIDFFATVRTYMHNREF